MIRNARSRTALLFALTCTLTACAFDPESDDESTEETAEAEQALMNCDTGDCEPPPAPAAKPDLVPEKYYASACTYLNKNGQKHFMFRIKNVGQANAGMSTARLTIQALNGEPFNTKTFSIPALAPGESVLRDAPAPLLCTQSFGCYVTITADTNQNVVEKTESNNAMAFTCYP